MKPLHKIIMVGTTFVLAAATGHVMQNPTQFGLRAKAPAPELQARFDLANVQQVANVEPALAPAKVTGLQIEGIPQLPAMPQMQGLADDPGLGPLPSDDSSPVAGFAPGCEMPQIGVVAGASASVTVSLSAPCHAEQQVTIRHEGLSLPVQLSERGDWSGLIPALAEVALFEVDLPDGTILSASQPVNDLAAVNRIALSWQGPADFRLHAFEYGSGYGDAGDVNSLSPRGADTTLGGWMVAYDDAATGGQVQIYSAPAAMNDIRLELDATVSAANCGQDLGAEVRRLVAGKPEAMVPLRLAMPDCEGSAGGLDGGVVMALPDFPMAVASN